jgi:hypothetical protein
VESAFLAYARHWVQSTVLQKEKNNLQKKLSMVVVHTCDPRYSEGRGKYTMRSRLGQAKVS